MNYIITRYTTGGRNIRGILKSDKVLQENHLKRTCVQLKGKINVQNSLVLVKIAEGNEESFVYICRQEKSRKAAEHFLKLMM